MKKTTQEQQKLDAIRLQDKLMKGKSERDRVAIHIFNHGVAAVREVFSLPAPRITSIFYRSDCFERCKLAARQMLAKRSQL